MLGDQEVLLVTEYTDQGDYTHLSIVGVGVLCDVVRRRKPWTQTLGTWTVWEGERAECIDCRWKVADHLYDSEAA